MVLGSLRGVYNRRMTLRGWHSRCGGALTCGGNKDFSRKDAGQHCRMVFLGRRTELRRFCSDARLVLGARERKKERKEKEKQKKKKKHL